MCWSNKQELILNLDLRVKRLNESTQRVLTKGHSFFKSTYSIHSSGQKNVSQCKVSVNDAMWMEIQNTFDNLSHDAVSFKLKGKSNEN